MRLASRRLGCIIVPVCFPCSALDDSIPDSVPLTSWEKERRQQLEQIVSGGLAKFLEVGNALCELRNRRLYRTEFVTFEQYVLAKFALHRSSVDGVIRSAQTAQVLMDAGLQLPQDTSPTSLRSISALPGDELKTACWQLAMNLSPARAPSQPLVSRLCRLVRNCLDSDSEEDGESETSESRHSRDTYHGRRRIASPGREVPFVRPLLRLSSWQGFSAEIVLSSVNASSNASVLYRACDVMMSRCKELQTRLATAFPELADDTYVEQHQSYAD